jgi:formamidopyrimidine-DNA glycosylase
MDEATFREGVVGARIVSVSRRGKYLAINLDSGMMLVVHLRMTGALLFSDDPEDAHVRAVFTLDDGTIMRFTDVRKFGGLWLVDDLSQVTASLGPEPLDDAFLPDMIVAAVAGRKSPVKSIILDQKHIAGIGNIYADEACFLSGIDPRRFGNTLTAEEATLLHAAIREVLNKGIENGGASFRDYRNTTGNIGSMQ